MAATKYIGKWNYLGATEKDEDAFLAEEPEGDIKLDDIKGAINVFKKKVCVSQLPPYGSHGADLAYRALVWIQDVLYRDEHIDNCKVELFSVLIACVEAGPNRSHIELVNYLIDHCDMYEYIQEVRGTELKALLTCMAKKFTYNEKGLPEDEYAELLKSTNLIGRLSSEQVQSVCKEAVDLYMYCQCVDAPGPMSIVYEDISEELEQKYEDIKKEANKRKPIVSWKSRIQRIEEDILKEPNMDEDKASKLCDVLEKGVEYLKDNPQEYASHFEGYINVLAALLKCPDTKAVRSLMYPIRSLAENSPDNIQNNHQFFEKYAPLLGKMIKAAANPVCMKDTIGQLSEDVLQKAAGQFPKQTTYWIPYLTALVSVHNAKFGKQVEDILKNKKKFLNWKDNKAGGIEIIEKMFALPEGDENDADSESRPNAMYWCQGDIAEEIMNQMKLQKLVSDPDIQNTIMKGLGESLISLSETKIRIADNIKEHIDLKKDKSLALPLVTTIEKLFQDENHQWHICNAGMTAFSILNSVLEGHKNGKDLGAYNDLYLSIFKISMNRDHWDYDLDSQSVFGYILSSTLVIFCNLHRESKTAEVLKPILGDLIKNLGHENEDIASSITSSFQMIAMGKADVFVPYVKEIVDIYLETKSSDLLGLLSACYSQNPDPIDKNLYVFLEALDDADSSQYSNILDLLCKLAQKQPTSFSQADIDKLVKGDLLDDMYTSGTVLMLLQNIVLKQPEKFEKHLDYLLKQMTDTVKRAQIPGIIYEIVKFNPKHRKKVFSHYIKVMKESGTDYIELSTMLNPVRLLGLDDKSLLESQRDYIVWIRDNVSQLKDFASHIIDVIDGKTVDDITSILGKQQENMDNLDTRVTNTENDVVVLGNEVDNQGRNITVLRKDVDKHEGQIGNLEVIVDDTVLKVEEIDNKTLNNAPVWSRDVSKLLNPEDEHDWRLLAQRLGYSADDIRGWATQHDPCMSFLSEWFATHKTSEATKAVLKNLEEMNRLDASEIVGRALQAVENVIQDEPPDYVNPPPLFISYQWAHQPEVRLLRKHLEMAGFESWMDIGQMGGGDKLYAKIDEGIRAAKAVICCVTEKYAKSPNCNREVNLAVNLGKPIIPILLEHVAWPPPGSMGPIFGEYLYIRFFNSDPPKDPKEERFWPIQCFKELLMQLSYMKLIPEQTKITKAYENWWLPPEEEIIIPKKKVQPKKSETTPNSEGTGESQLSPDVFISYQWDIQPHVKSLYKRLSLLGYHCWMDIFQMGGGDSLYDKIDRGVRGSHVVISCVTEKYAKSANCRREVSLADALKKPIIPLMMEDSTWPPSGPMSMVFTQLLYIQFTDPKLQQTWTGTKFDELLEKLQFHLPNSERENAGVKRMPQAPKSTANKPSEEGKTLKTPSAQGSEGRTSNLPKETANPADKSPETTSKASNSQKSSSSCRIL